MQWDYDRCWINNEWITAIWFSEQHVLRAVIGYFQLSFFELTSSVSHIFPPIDLKINLSLKMLLLLYFSVIPKSLKKKFWANKAHTAIVPHIVKVLNVLLIYFCWHYTNKNSISYILNLYFLDCKSWIMKWYTENVHNAPVKWWVVIVKWMTLKPPSLSRNRTLPVSLHPSWCFLSIPSHSFPQS